ncbi:ABC transporter G member 28 [Dionaea muscipula]
MRTNKGNGGSWIRGFTLGLILLSSTWLVNCQRPTSLNNTQYGDEVDNLEERTNATYSRFSNISHSIGPMILEQFSFCVKDVYADWNAAFDFEGNLSFLTECIRSTRGDMMQRLCTIAEIKLYFGSYIDNGASGGDFIKPNKNCNSTSWLSGCEPGWACTVGEENAVDLKNSKELPDRTIYCQSCCEGFFCPRGLTCMIRCLLAYALLPAECCAASLSEYIVQSLNLVFPEGYAGSVYLDRRDCDYGYWEICMSLLNVDGIPQLVLLDHIAHFLSLMKLPVTVIRCLKLTDCDPESRDQNITAYGVMLFAGLTVLLVILYNCSDQVISLRERQQAKSREAAARSAKETVQARERWKSAKEVAKKHAVGLQTSLSRTFSRRKSVKQTEQLKVADQEKPGIDVALQPLPTNTAATPKDSSAVACKESNGLTKMMREIEGNPDEHEGFSLEIGDKNLKKNTKPKKLHTKSQIFKYAYGQIEKEKALQQQNGNLTFSGIISMATDIEIRKRPTIEVSFQDLTLTLKAKNKHVLRSVTGKISPGRVSAVMGPSGAGKTTFLSALTGKTTGCTRSGSILINGKAESIHSYKKIIGFVPQDDIVHGNLTVEENLWFSAKCRLSAKLPKAEKVLVVERVIESLGLQAVRDSLVGTVEKRGISGGQRKRVNVGLEMVMEPSLLILDEPTSGLDSSSSQLLLRALRREAFEGVNICMVLHQPSYTLFKMFDDLILLAKGGLLVYLGPAKKVEEYFAGLGISVPERVNPPDHFIDILEGIVKPESDVDYKELPIRWMVHNGYTVPLDLQNDLGFGSSGGEISAQEENPAASSSAGQSFAKDLWQDVKCFLQLKSDHIQNNLFMSHDSSNRITPGVFQQCRYFLGRVGKQRLREARIQAVDYLILLLAGACLGTLAKVSDESFGAAGYSYTVIAVSLLCKIAALRSFSLDKIQYWRESSSGMSTLAHFLAKDLIDLFNIIIKPVVYLSMFYFFNNPRSSFLENYVILACLVYCVTGIGYAFAIFFEPGSAQLWSALLPVVLTLIATQQKERGLVSKIDDLCYPKWALEAFVIANAQRYPGVWLITRCGALLKSGYNVNEWGFCLCILIVTGQIGRVVAFNLLLFSQKK